MNTLCIVLLVSLTGYVRSVVVNGECGTGDTPADCDDGLYCEDSKCKVKVDVTCRAEPADQCIMGATCVSSICKCMANHTANADMTKCLMNIGGVCEESTDCVQGSPKVQCTNKMCACTAMYAPNDMMNMCMMIIGETCVTKADCVEGDTDRVVCDADKKCACAATYAANVMMNMCKLELNETCSGDVDCGMNAMCSTDIKRCACKANFVNEENRCGMKVGGACTGDTYCVMNAVCKSEKCACKGTYTSDGDYCKSGSAAVVASLLLLVAALVTSRLM